MRSILFFAISVFAISAGLLQASACNTADLSYPPSTDASALGDGAGNDGCLDRCTSLDGSMSDADADVEASGETSTDGNAVDAPADVLTDRLGD